MFSFKKLWHKLLDLGMTKEQFRTAVGLSPTTIAAMGKGVGLTPKVLARICEYLSTGRHHGIYSRFFDFRISP